MSFTTAQMKRAISDICEADPKFRPIVEESPLCRIGHKPSAVSHFESLVESVISQQLAMKAAETIHGRLVSLAGGKITPAKIAKLSEVDLRSAGLSGAKVRTIQGLSSAALSGEVEINKLHLIDDESIEEQLNSLWGIGPWTVDMFMIFQLGRVDIWPTGDLGVRRGWEKIHRLREHIEPEKLLVKGEKFRPHRSIVAWYCWRAVEGK
ncbi:MAG: DNA-3-methyladenine glycosylase 2 family protein [Actinobacteria bacterium]|nr:DNA-3-methyladenine glycosylase 2 family protein [Actinomycetota bacterium]